MQYKKDYIKFLKENGMQEISKNFVGTKTPDNSKDETDLLDELISKLQQDVLYIEKHLKFIEIALDNVRDDTYFTLIELKYFKGKSMEFIAEYYDVSVKTIYNQRDRLIHILRKYLFAEDVISDFFQRRD
jgi:predicted DNA-binding protein YlxM (UPF0122 family)